jgi:hypothetical protein
MLFLLLFYGFAFVSICLLHPCADFASGHKVLNQYVNKNRIGIIIIISIIIIIINVNLEFDAVVRSLRHF